MRQTIRARKKASLTVFVCLMVVFNAHHMMMGGLSLSGDCIWWWRRGDLIPNIILIIRATDNLLRLYSTFICIYIGGFVPVVEEIIYIYMCTCVFAGMLNVWDCVLDSLFFVLCWSFFLLLLYAKWDGGRCAAAGWAQSDPREFRFHIICYVYTRRGYNTMRHQQNLNH